MRFLFKAIARDLAPRPLRNWLRTPRRSARWLLNEARHLCGKNYLIEMRPGWFLRCHPTAYDFAYHLQNNDPDQIAEFDGFISSCTPRMVLLDVGAHFGLFSLAALHFGGLEAKALAIDPSPIATRIMNIQLRMNGVEGRGAVVQASASDQNGWQGLVATGVNGAGFFLPPQDHAGREITKTRATTLDALAKEHNLKPTHIKIDVEGGEAEVLRGSEQLLSHVSPPLLLLELHNELIRSRCGNPSETLNLLKKFGYQAYSFEMRPLSDDFILSQPLVRVLAKRQ